MKEGRESVNAEGNHLPRRNGNRRDIMGIQEGNWAGYNMASPKVELPNFSRETHCGWIRKCWRFFKLHLKHVQSMGCDCFFVYGRKG